jgi:hypothetical protein
MKPLSVGNVVSAGLRIYRDNFKKYFKLAFIGYLWILVPFYGWAKYSAMTGLISRLAYGVAVEQPESLRDAQRHLKPKIWRFFFMGLLVSLIFLGAMLAYTIFIFVASFISGFILNQNPGGILSAIAILLVVTAVLILIFGLIWLISRLFLVEVPLAIEDGLGPGGTISRSWQLTKGSAGRIQLVVFLTFLISLPIGIVINILSAILQLMIGAGFENSNGSAGLGIIAGVIYFIFLVAASALIMPLWQSIKAVVYYDLRIRREGMGMNLRK